MHIRTRACMREYTRTLCALNSLCCFQSLNQCDFSVPHKITFPELIMTLSGALSLPKWLIDCYLLSGLPGNEGLVRLLRTHYQQGKLFLVDFAAELFPLCRGEWRGTADRLAALCWTMTGSGRHPVVPDAFGWTEGRT